MRWRNGIHRITRFSQHPLRPVLTSGTQMQPLRALFAIPTKPPPTLSEPAKWSDDFRDFCAKCLVKEVKQRATAKQLLEVGERHAAPA